MSLYASYAPTGDEDEGGGVKHYEYVFPSRSIYVYDMDAASSSCSGRAAAAAKGIRGVAASPVTHTLYVSYGGDRGSNGSGSLLAYDLLGDKVLWSAPTQTGSTAWRSALTGPDLHAVGELHSSNWTSSTRRAASSTAQHPRRHGRAQHDR